uniref:Endonuclease V n=1 Tax=Populus davidiana TaxID=266767 RepID=A0A6M2EUD5_9ROSI
MDDHGLRHGRDRGESSSSSSSSSSIEIQNQWREIQDLLKERLITQDDFPWKLPIPSSSGNVAVEEEEPIPSSSGNVAVEEEEEGTLLKYVGGVDVSYSKELDSAAAASTAACGCGSLVVLDITTPALQVVYQDFFLLTNFDVPYIPSFLPFREAPILLQLLQKMKNTDNPFYPQLLLVDGNGLLHPRGFGLACHLGVLANIPTIGIGKNVTNLLLLLNYHSFIT